MSIFDSVPVTKLSRSTFNLDHEVKASFNFGYNIPLMCQLMLPGDKASLVVQNFLRSVPLLSPVMHRNDIKIDSYFVPWRLIWKNYEAFLQCKDATIKMPQIYFPDDVAISQDLYNSVMGVGSLADYLGFASVPITAFSHGTSSGKHYINIGHGSDRKLCALPFRAYQLIYDYYYRNKTLEDSILQLDNYDITSNDDYVLSTISAQNWMFHLRQRSWRRDQFTSALPDPQKGNPVAMPTGDIVSDGPIDLKDSEGTVSNGALYVDNSPAVKRGLSEGQSYQSTAVSQSYNSGLSIDPPSIEDFRYAEVLEEYEEALARSGSAEIGSFKEWLFSIWRTISPDARLDRPEYLGGYRGPIQISEVPQTSQGTESSPQGTLAGKGLSVGGKLLFRKHSFKEPGYLMVIMSVVPKSAYFQGDPRQFLYQNCFDFPNPYFANLGEQEVYAQEVCASQALFNNEQLKTFGYQVRNYEMKQIPDSIHGAFRDSLLYWHEARRFPEYVSGAESNPPVNLNQNFVKIYPDEVSRIFPVIENTDKLLGQFLFNFRVKRSLPYYGVPRVGHNK